MGSVRKGSVVVTSLDRAALRQALLREHGAEELARELPPPPFVLAGDVTEAESTKMLRDLATMGVQAVFEPAPVAGPAPSPGVAQASFPPTADLPTEPAAGRRLGRSLRMGVRLAVLLVLGVVAYKHLSRDHVANLLHYYGAPSSVVAWVANLPTPFAVSGPAGAPALAGDAALPPNVMTGPATAMRQTFEAQYRLQPDRRLLGAFACLLQASAQWGDTTAKSEAMVVGEPVYEDNATLVIPLVSTAKGRKSLGEVRIAQPLQFEAWGKALGQWMDLLAQHGRPMPAARPSMPEETLAKASDLLMTADPLAMLEALTMLEAAGRATASTGVAGGLDVRAVRLAARAYTLLALTLTLEDDAAGQADSLASSALGLLVLAGRLDPTLAGATAVEQSLLAQVLGYGDAAMSLAATAPVAGIASDSFDALALAHVRQDLAALHPDRAGKSLLATWLRASTAQSLSLWQDMGQILEPLREVAEPPTPFYALASYTLPVESAQGVSQNFPGQVLRLFASRGGDVPKGDAQALPSLKRFAASVQRWTPPVAGSPGGKAGNAGDAEKADAAGLLVDASRQRAVFLALYASALTARHYVLAERIASGSRTAEFLQGLADDDTGTDKDEAGPLLLLWRAQHQAEAGQRAEAEQLAAAALASGNLSPNRAYHAFTLFDDYQTQLRMAPVVARCLDSRPEGWSALGKVFHVLSNGDLALAAYAHALESNDRDFDAVRNMAAIRKDDLPFEAAKSRHPDNFTLLRLAAEYNKELDTPESTRRALGWYTEAARLEPENVALNLSRGWVLLKLGQVDESMAVLNKLIAQKPENALLYARCKACLAQACLKKGQTAEALQHVGEVLESYQAGVMMDGVEVYEAAGQTDIAETWLARALKRYPSTDHVLAGAAGYYWRKGEHAKAAAVVRQGRASQGARARWYRRTFLKVFAEAPKASVMTAVNALVATGASGREIVALGEAFLHAGKPEVALGVLQVAPATHAMDALDYAASMYPAMQILKGDAAARKFLAGKVDPSKRGPFSMILFTHGLYDILLEDYQHPEAFGPDYREFIQLVRLLAWLGKDRAPASLEAEFLPHYRQASKDFYHAAGRLFLGLVTEQEFLASIATPKQRCEAAYYLGLHHRLRGDFAQAALWYQICLETGLVNNGEYHWAVDELSRWTSLGLSRRHRLAGEERRLQAALP